MELDENWNRCPSLRGTWMCLPNLIPIHLVDVEMGKFKLWPAGGLTKRQTLPSLESLGLCLHHNTKSLSPDEKTDSCQPQTETSGGIATVTQATCCSPGLARQCKILFVFSEQSHVVLQHFGAGIGHVSDDCPSSKRDIDPNHFANSLRGHVLVDAWGGICLSV